MKKLLPITLFIAFINCSVAFSQPKSSSASPYVEKEIVQWNFSSKTIGEDYTIYIHFPPEYDTSKTKYPVLYMTDGDWNMTVAMNCFNMLRQDYNITTEPLIVGIGYGTRPNKRSRDLDPGKGGPNFLAFIQTEVMPFIEKQYRVTDNKTLYGYSLGGMFTTYVLFQHPGSFNMIGIGAPGNGGNDLMPEAEKYFATNKDLNAKVFLGVGSYEHMVVNNIVAFKSYIDKQSCKNLELLTGITPNAAHGAALAQVMQNAIAFFYCNTHKAIDIDAAELKKYTGTYAEAKDPDGKLTVYVNNNALFVKGRDNLPIHLVPFTSNGFFMPENERISILFKTEAGKNYLVVESPGEKPTLIEKIN
jgi:predicted alpha/beta superfamily hydrolase